MVKNTETEEFIVVIQDNATTTINYRKTDNEGEYFRQM